MLKNSAYKSLNYFGRMEFISIIASLSQNKYEGGFEHWCSIFFAASGEFQGNPSGIEIGGEGVNVVSFSVLGKFRREIDEIFAVCTSDTVR